MEEGSLQPNKEGRKMTCMISFMLPSEPGKVNNSRVICFDLWNTLIASLDPTGASYEQTLINSGVCQSDIYPIVRDHLMNKGLGYEQMAEILCNHFGITDQEVGLRVIASWQNDNTKTRWFKGAKTMLKKLRQSNTLVLISNITAPGWETVNQRLGIDQHFDKLLLSFQEGVSKPSPELWDRVKILYPEAKEYWMIGDNVADDLLIPRKLGWNTIRVEKDGSTLTLVRKLLEGDDL